MQSWLELYECTKTFEMKKNKKKNKQNYLKNSSKLSVNTFIYSTKNVKEISENHATKEHQSKQLFNFFICLDTFHWLKKMLPLVC